MSLPRASRTAGLLSLLTLAFAVAWLLWPRNEVEAQPGARWSYAAKFVCGFSPSNIGLGDTGPNEPPISTGEATVKRGNYATEVNLFNPHNFGFEVHRSVLVLYDGSQVSAAVGREPRQVGSRDTFHFGLGPLSASMLDCNRIYNLAGVNPGVDPPLLIGFVVFNSQQPIQVTAVHTAELCSNTRGFFGNCESRNNNSNFGVGMSIDVEQIPGQVVAGP